MPSKTTQKATKTKAVSHSKQLSQVQKTHKLTAPVYDASGRKTATITLPNSVFDVHVSKTLLAQAVYVYQTNKRQQSAHVKTRGDVAGSGRKIYRQKGTGRARHGDRYAPIFVGGGVAHGPAGQTWNRSLSKQMKKKAFAAALTIRNKEGVVAVVDGLGKLEAKTSVMVTALSKCSVPVKYGKVQEQTLVLTTGDESSVYRALRNEPKTHVENAGLISTVEILRYLRIVIVKDAVKMLEKRVSTV